MNPIDRTKPTLSHLATVPGTMNDSDIKRITLHLVTFDGKPDGLGRVNVRYIVSYHDHKTPDGITFVVVRCTNGFYRVAETLVQIDELIQQTVNEQDH